MSAPQPESVWDPGLQPERTSLAWRRLALTLLIAAMATPKLAWTILGEWSLIPTAAVVIAALALLLMSHSRYERTAWALHAEEGGALPDARLQAVAAGTGLVISALAAVLVLFAH